jgi:hypothetical protein
MDRASPYEQPTTAIEQADPPIRFIDPRGVTRFLQVFLVLRAGCSALGVALSLALTLLHRTLFDQSTYETFIRQYGVFVIATTIVLAFAFTAWLWISQRNQLALGLSAAHHWMPLLLAGFGLLSLNSFYALDQLGPFTFVGAAFATLGSAYVGYFLHRALQADAPRSQGTRLVLSFRLWLVATACAILVPSILVWRMIHAPNAEFDYQYYSRESSSLFVLASEACLVAVAARLADWQRATHAYMQGGSEGKTLVPSPAI